MRQSQEARLVDYIERIERRRGGRKAVHVKLSSMRQHDRRDYHLRVAANTFETLVSNYEGDIFRLANHDIVFILREVDPVQVDEAMTRLAYLFNDDPLTDSSSPDLIADHCDWFDLERDYERFLALANRLYEEAQKRSKRVASLAGAAGDAKPPVDPHNLGALIDAISSADLTNLMRRQVIYALLSKQPPKSLFQELFISIPDLQQLILPGHNIYANRWLFQYLTETLDRRMLALLLRNDDPAIATSFSLNLNVATVLSQEFLAFDASLKAGARGTIVIELQMIDVYADLSTFAFARDFAHNRGYRLCLDGLTEQTFPFVDRSKLDIDLLKLDWSSFSPDATRGPRLDRLRSLVDQAGKARVILCHVDGDEGLKFGQAIGVAMYQGRYIDQMSSPRWSGLRPR
jgi:EAL domain-containing protein (putative c-di-GMP-specific phosphodiesterase class I)